MDKIYSNFMETDEKLLGSFESSLTTAVKENNLASVKQHLENREPVNNVDITGISPLYRAIKENKVAILHAMLHKVIIKDARDQHGDTPLVSAIRNNSTMETINCLLRKGGDINESKTAKTPLAWAAEVGNIEIVKFLINSGADISQISRDGNTPLGTAVRFRKIAIVELLIEKKADIHTFSGADGRSPLRWAICNADVPITNYLFIKGARFTEELFLDAIATQNLDIVRFLVLKGARVTKAYYDNLATPLLTAVNIGTVEIARYLIERGARVVEDLGRNEVSKMMELIQYDKAEMAMLLAEKGARINEYGANGETLLTTAARDEDFQMVKYFLARGVDPNKANKDGKKPLHLAAESSDFQSFQCLMGGGAVLSKDELAKNEQLARYFRMGCENLKDIKKI